MRIVDLVEGAIPRNGTLENGLTKMANGYHKGFGGHDSSTCYAYVGAELARRKPAEATIRFWGLKERGLVVHGDAVLPSGEVISTYDPEEYSRKGYQLVTSMPLRDFLATLR